MGCAPWVVPTVAQFQAQFFRDFPYAPAQLATDTSDATLSKYVINQDIQNAIDLANVDFNSGLFGDMSQTIFMYLAAHYLIVNIRDSSMGLNSQPKWILDASSVGGVSISNNINERFASDPNFSKYLTTGKGQIYLDLVYPFTVGNVQLNCGQSTSA